MAKAKKKSIFFCKECGFESAKWLGQCPGCKEWNSFVEEPVIKNTAGKEVHAAEKKEPSRLSEVSVEKEERVLTGIGDKVKFTKNGDLLEAEVIVVETLNKSDVSFITYVVMTKDGRFFRRYEYELNDLTS